MICFTLALLAFLAFVASFLRGDFTSFMLVTGTLASFGVPSYYWVSSIFDKDQKENQTKFLDTFYWCTGLWLTFLYLEWLVLAIKEGNLDEALGFLWAG